MVDICDKKTKRHWKVIDEICMKNIERRSFYCHGM